MVQLQAEDGEPPARPGRGRRWRWALALGALLAVAAALLWWQQRALLLEVYAWQLGRELPPAAWVPAARRLAELDPAGARALRLQGAARLRWLLANGPPGPSPAAAAPAAEAGAGAQPGAAGAPALADEALGEAEIARRVARNVRGAQARIAEAVALCASHPQLAREALLQADDPAVLRRAAEWLAATGERRYLPWLLEALARPAPAGAALFIYGAAARLARGDGEATAAVLRAALARPQLRQRALMFATEVGPPAVPPLAELLDDRQLEPVQRAQVVGALERITGARHGGDAAAWKAWYQAHAASGR
ncbi:MAG: hypothetical protein KatS3mg102_2566 [Planctomycetota bacterium]|nr:MAG: hypothetical protein KatS3mg102_2566 [Planctomycetota bacterium]